MDLKRETQLIFNKKPEIKTGVQYAEIKSKRIN
jgi:hypothetical protein